ncbi:DUF5063 domain-containing protein [Saccharicrinis sp. FJH62]|uniref:DUF5063 domain-containing protein n=1 Tax=Saccharicrinis sp. FJH62 TaxID=3344657 RepID=UPI0035D5112A
MDDVFEHIVYSKDVVEFVTVANQFCLFVEQSSTQSADEFVDKVVKILPLLYLKGTMLPKVDREFEDPLERIVTEEDYMAIRDFIEYLLGKSDVYLEVFHPEIKYSDAPVRVNISEDIADIYQDIKDFISLYQMGSTEIMNDALAEVVDNFREYWGQKLVNVLRALHNLNYSEERIESIEEEDDFYKRTDVSRSFVAKRQNEWRNEEEDF